MHHKALWALTKRANRGFHGYPLATVAFYGPDDRRASKAVVGIVPAEGVEPTEIERWFSSDTDLRNAEDTMAAVRQYIEQHGARTVIVAERILGCPHEEGVDYPRGEKCPQCPFWASHDRWSGQLLN